MKKMKKKKTLNHEFDGIKEYDNPIPIWFQIIFYGTIYFQQYTYFIIIFTKLGIL